jgi:hypothetical protein
MGEIAHFACLWIDRKVIWQTASWERATVKRYASSGRADRLLNIAACVRTHRLHPLSKDKADPRKAYEMQLPEKTAPTAKHHFDTSRDDTQSIPYQNERLRAMQLGPELESLGLKEHIADLALYGYTVVPPEKIAPPAYFDDLKQAVLRISEQRFGSLPENREGLTEIGRVHPLGQFMRYTLFDDPIFEPLLTNPVLLGLITYLVGYDALLSLHDATIKGAGSMALPLHNDNGDKSTSVYADQPQSANINLILTDYGPGSGPIAFLPGSHKFRREPTPTEQREMLNEMVEVHAPAGSAIIWPANTWHTATSRTDDGLRITLLYDFCRGHLQTQEIFRDEVTEDMLARNPARFAQLLHVHGIFPYKRDDISPERQSESKKRYSLFDCHKMWKPFYNIKG